jgi:hypothetical protein
MQKDKLSHDPVVLRKIYPSNIRHFTLRDPSFSSMANPTPLFNRVGFMVFLAGLLLFEAYAFEVLPVAAIAFWILSFDGIRASVGWNWSRTAARPTVTAEFQRLLKQDLAGWKLLGAVAAVLLFWFLRKAPVNIPQILVFVLGLSLVSGALRMEASFHFHRAKGKGSGVHIGALGLGKYDRRPKPSAPGN